MSVYIIIQQLTPHQAIKDKQQELIFCILKGCCPYCSAKRLQYREFVANCRFGFHCHNCGWRNEFSRQDLIKFSHRHF